MLDGGTETTETTKHQAIIQNISEMISVGDALRALEWQCRFIPIVGTRTELVRVLSGHMQWFLWSTTANSLRSTAASFLPLRSFCYENSFTLSKRATRISRLLAHSSLMNSLSQRTRCCRLQLLLRDTADRFITYLGCFGWSSKPWS